MLKPWDQSNAVQYFFWQQYFMEFQIPVVGCKLLKLRQGENSSQVEL